MASFCALFDACVLYPYSVRDILLELSNADLFRGRWSDKILDECFAALEKNLPDAKDKLMRTRELMVLHAEHASIEGYQYLEEALSLPDSGDNHVLAAAIHGRADVIVTYNLKDFPADLLSPYGIEAQHPDEFLSHLLDLDAGKVCGAIRTCRARLQNPAMSVGEYLEALQKRELLEFVDGLKHLSDAL